MTTYRVRNTATDAVTFVEAEHPIDAFRAVTKRKKGEVHITYPAHGTAYVCSRTPNGSTGTRHIVTTWS